MSSISSLNIVILGLSITSSWGNGHATTYRSLVKALVKRGHRVLFLERDVYWYADNRDLPHPPFGTTRLYNNLDELREKYYEKIKNADMVIIGSYVPEGVEAVKFVLNTASGIKAFYDIDTPVTIAKLERMDYEYISPDQISHFDLYLSFTGGPTLQKIKNRFNAPMVKALYCSFDPDLYYKQDHNLLWDLGYLGTYSNDRQPKVNELMIKTASLFKGGRFILAGPNYPKDIQWPQNIERISHLPPDKHRAFYNSQRFTLNITRADMVKAGYSPSVRLFEAAACGTPIISDYWEGLEEFFEPDKEILIAETFLDTLKYMKLEQGERNKIGRRAQERVLALHSADNRAAELEEYYNIAVRSKTEQNI